MQKQFTKHELTVLALLTTAVCQHLEGQAGAGQWSRRGPVREPWGRAEKTPPLPRPRAAGWVARPPERDIAPQRHLVASEPGRQLQNAASEPPPNPVKEVRSLRCLPHLRGLGGGDWGAGGSLVGKAGEGASTLRIQPRAHPPSGLRIPARGLPPPAPGPPWAGDTS